jgi:FkbM family methyltransferase
VTQIPYQYETGISAIKAACATSVGTSTDYEFERSNASRAGSENRWRDQDVVFRRGNSDITCLEKVFRTQDYKTPFPTEAKVIVDAGANIGMATLYYSQVYPKAKIIAIEPESSNYKMLVKNCGNLPNVTLIEGALWSEERHLVIQNPNADEWAYSVAEIQSPSRSGLPEVRAVTVPGLMKSLGVDHIDILKLDIEGAEYELFNNGAQNWLGAVRQIVIELHDRIRPGCARSFYAAIGLRPFIQEIGGENTFIKFEEVGFDPAAPER